MKKYLTLFLLLFFPSLVFANTYLLVVNLTPWSVCFGQSCLSGGDYVQILIDSAPGLVNISVKGHGMRIIDSEFDNGFHASDNTKKVSLYTDNILRGTLSLPSDKDSYLTLLLDSEPMDNRAFFYELYDTSQSLWTIPEVHIPFSTAPGSVFQKFPSYISSLK